jgi:hypothetical protein
MAIPISLRYRSSAEGAGFSFPPQDPSKTKPAKTPDTQVRFKNTFIKTFLIFYFSAVFIFQQFSV